MMHSSMVIKMYSAEHADIARIYDQFNKATALVKSAKASKRMAPRSYKFQYNPLIIRAMKIQHILYDRYEAAVTDWINKL